MYIRELRRAVLPRLKADSRVTDLVSPAQIYPSTVPAGHGWPFIRWDAPISSPRGRGCTAGADITFYVHAFAKAPADGSETAESLCERIMNAIGKALNGWPVTLDGATAKLRVRSVRTMMDGDEADAWHGLVDVIAKVTRT